VTIYCKKCGAPNEEDAIFCENCGARLEEEPEKWKYPIKVEITQ